MTTRKAYAKSTDGKAAFMFQSKALRDFFLENVEGYENATCAEYRSVKRRDEDSVDEWGNVTRYSPYNAFDMGIAENWDGWWDAYDAACELGLM